MAAGIDAQRHAVFGTAAARWSTPNRPALTLVDSAEENSVTTQSQISSPSGSCALSQAWMRSVAASLVSAATSSEVSR